MLASSIALLVTLLKARPAVAITTVVGSALLLSPTIHPWYLAWLVPFVAIHFSASWFYVTTASLLAYLAVPSWLEGRVWVESSGSKAILAIPFLLLGTWEIRRWFLGRARSGSEGV